MKRKILLRAVTFCILLGFLFYKCYGILGYYDNIHSKTVFQQFYNLPKNSVDVIWLGPSSTQEFIIPTVMYEETGLALYSLSVGNEPFMAAEYLIKEAEKTQNPEVYLVDIRHLSQTIRNDSLIRRITDNMKWSQNRIKAINYMTKNLDTYSNSNVTDAKLDYYFSFNKYHTRWSELHKEDFGYDDNSFFGYFIRTICHKFDEDTIKSRFNTASIPISYENMNYLNDFLNFCDIFNKTVIFTRTPHCLEEELFGQYNYIQNVIEKRGYEVWNFNENVDEIGIDYSTDFCDPMHTNVYGAQKVSSYAAKKLMERFHFSDHRGDSKYTAYQKMAENFNEKLQEAELKSCVNFSEYLDKLIALDKNEYSVYIAVKDIQGYCLTPELTGKLKRLGFDKADILLKHIYHTFIGVIANGTVLAEKIGYNNDPVYFSTEINGQNVDIISMAWANGNIGSIKLGTVDYSKNKRGFNIVVVDNKDGLILDSVTFDTHIAEMTCSR